MTEQEWYAFRDQAYQVIHNLSWDFAKTMRALVENLAQQWTRACCSYALSVQRPTTANKLKADQAYKEFLSMHKIVNMHMLRAKLMDQ